MGITKQKCLLPWFNGSFGDKITFWWCSIRRQQGQVQWSIGSLINCLVSLEAAHICCNITRTTLKYSWNKSNYHHIAVVQHRATHQFYFCRLPSTWHRSPLWLVAGVVLCIIWWSQHRLFGKWHIALSFYFSDVQVMFYFHDYTVCKIQTSVFQHSF